MTKGCVMLQQAQTAAPYNSRQGDLDAHMQQLNFQGPYTQHVQDQQPLLMVRPSFLHMSVLHMIILVHQGL